MFREVWQTCPHRGLARRQRPARGGPSPAANARRCRPRPGRPARRHGRTPVRIDPRDANRPAPLLALYAWTREVTRTRRLRGPPASRSPPGATSLSASPPAPRPDPSAAGGERWSRPAPVSYPASASSPHDSRDFDPWSRPLLPDVCEVARSAAPRFTTRIGAAGGCRSPAIARRTGCHASQCAGSVPGHGLRLIARDSRSQRRAWLGAAVTAV